MNVVKVVDFGIAKLTNVEGVSTGNTQTGMVMGTPAYMSPEQASGRTQLIDARSDVYSVGVMMFQLATGRLPFPGSAFGEVLIGHIQTPPPRPRELNPAIPEAYETVILRTLQKRQEDRYQSMHELHDAIARVMQQFGISADLPTGDTSEEMETITSRTPSNPGPRTPSQPGRSTDPRAAARRSSPPPVRPRPSASGRTPPARSHPRMAQPEEQPTLPASSAEKSRAPLLAAIAIVLAVLGIAGYLVQKSLAAAQEAKFAADEAMKARSIASAPPAARAQPQPQDEPVFVVVVSDPLDAQVTATWSGGQKQGTTPLSIEAPKNAKVHLEITKSGYLPYRADLVADAAQTFTAKMTAVAAASPVAVQHATEPVAKKPLATKKKQKKRDVPSDGLFDIEDALK